MTNPFATFRKNQKYWMAALVLLAILAFVVAPVFDYMSQAIRGGGPSNDVVVRWDGGQLTVSEVQLAAQTHSSMVRFFSEVAKQVVEAGGEPRVPGFQLDPASRQILGLGIQASSSPADICQTRILAAKAKQLGVAFDDNAVDEFITAYTDGKISTKQLASILAEASGGALSYFEVRELLKDELSAMIVQQTALAGVIAEVQSQPTPITSPGATFDNFLKLNRTAKVEAFPVFVDDYLNQVSDSPTEEEIQAIYDQGSLRAPNPDSPEPGFIRRYKANVEYVEANMQQWIEREKAKLTEEQLREEYDRRVELGQLQVPVAPEGQSTEPGASDSERPPSPETTTPAETQPGAAGDASEAAASEAGASADASEQPAGETATEDSGPAATEEAVEKAPGEGDQSSTTRAKARFVAYTQEEGEQTAEPADTPPPVVQPPALDPKSSEVSGGETTDGDAAAADPSAPGDEPAVPTMRTQTFEEAKDSIADSLARDVAINSLDDALNDLFDNTMRPYSFEYRQYNALASNDELKDEVEEQDPPQKPDLKKLAEEKGFIYGSTGLVDRTALITTPFGQGMVRPDESGINGRVGDIVMSPGLELFRPLRSTYFDQAALMQGGIPEFLQYLFWKTEEREAYIPDLLEVREEVVEAWRRDKARIKAETAARDLAKKVGTGDQAWDEALSDAEKALIVSTDPFTWMNRMGDFITESAVPKLDRVGAEFMRTVFSTPTGQVAVAPNAPKNVYYVFRLIEIEPPQQELQDRFEADPIKAGPRQIASSQTQDLLRGWFARIEEEMNVQWQMNLQQL